ncbi:hypothetical protein QVD17_14400 [Tagetes erecta]|uniref:Uncharacterized protein n=1 Tax=Tagetes erecta TaxID=13708 RepID=A0AAD8L1P3_TARER|nr:hypothetical protein QVD17_14400 [Tagetes erecta]
MSNKLMLLSFVALTFVCLALAYEPKPLQDFCVADPNNSVKVNGLLHVEPKLFFFNGYQQTSVKFHSSDLNPGSSKPPLIIRSRDQ